MQTDEWVVLAEHSPEVRPYDDAEMLYLEAVLRDESIDALFDPCRPGEWVGPGYGGPPQIRLLVMRHDLDRAKQILLDLESSAPADSGYEAGSDSDDDSDEVDALDAQSDIAGEPSAASFRPAPMNKPINPGCAMLLLSAIAAVGALSVR